VGGVFEDIPNANMATLTIDPATEDLNGAVYRLKITDSGQDIFSNEVTLTVTPDTQLARPIAAGAFANTGIVGVAFDEALHPSFLGFYTVNGQQATPTLYLDRYVRLESPVPLTGPFQVAVTGAQDLAGNASGTQTVNGTINDLSSQILGDEFDPIEGGDTFTWGTGYYVAGGGSDIWANADHGFFVYKQFTGSFDMRARVDDLVGGDEWGKATLMARETLDAGSRNQAVLITKPAPYIPPTTGGVSVYNMQWRDTTDGTSASIATERRISPTVFPSWIRLVRESATSNEIDSYISYNGTDWVALDTHVTPGDLLPATLYLGMAVTSHDNAPGFPRAEVAYENFSIEPFGGSTFNPNLRISGAANGALTIQWNQGVLVSSPAVTGPYQPVLGANNVPVTSPYVTSASDNMRFYQVRNP
jgi:hypothetical protein